MENRNLARVCRAFESTSSRSTMCRLCFFAMRSAPFGNSSRGRTARLPLFNKRATVRLTNDLYVLSFNSRIELFKRMESFDVNVSIDHHLVKWKLYCFLNDLAPLVFYSTVTKDERLASRSLTNVQEILPIRQFRKLCFF